MHRKDLQELSKVRLKEATALLKLELAILISLLFMCCLLSLILSLATFIVDIHQSLKALKMEMARRESGAAV